MQNRRGCTHLGISLRKRKGGGGGGGGRGGGSSHNSSSGGGKGKGTTNGGSTTNPKPMSAGSSHSATPYGPGGGKPSIIPAGQLFAGRSVGGGTRTQVFGKR